MGEFDRCYHVLSHDSVTLLRRRQSLLLVVVLLLLSLLCGRYAYLAFVSVRKAAPVSSAIAAARVAAAAVPVEQTRNMHQCLENVLGRKM